MKRVAWALLLVFLLSPAGQTDPPTVLQPDRDAIEVAADAALAAGTWLVSQRDGHGVLRITTDGVTLDLHGATLRGAPEGAAPDSLTGVGILVENAKGVTIRNGTVAGFRIGIRAVNAPGLAVVGVDASGNFKQRLKSTPEKEDASDWLWPHFNENGEWETRYGAGISLNDCRGATVRDCTVRHGQNGLLLTRCRECYAYDNDFSFNSGWGIALYRTGHSEISHNRLDFCVRGYSHGVYYRGQDSAAILVFEQCSHNLFLRNSATHSGDGFFLYAGHETTQQTGKGGSNYNRVYANDFRFAVANGIEATFSAHNVFQNNRCSGSDHGIWAGYSRESAFIENHARDCLTAGISIEHGHHNVIVGNQIAGARYGIHLWWDVDRELLDGAYGRAQDCSSSHNHVGSNRLAGTVAALRLWGDTQTEVVGNEFPAAETRVQLGPKTAVGSLRANSFQKVTFENRTGAPLLLPTSNRIARALRFEGDVVRFAPGRDEEVAPGGVLFPYPQSRGTRDVSYPADLPSGRDQMRIDEWGPVDPRQTRFFPGEQQASGPVAKLHLLGGRPFRVVEASGGVTVVPREGTAPATLEVRVTAAGPAIRPFHVAVESGGERFTASGTLVRMAWDVSFFAWTEREDPVTKPEAFATLLAGRPAHREERTSLDFPWQGGGPEGLSTDHFATSATSTVTLPAGRFRLRVVSDDGVRLFVDDEKVLERWDRHGPTEDVAELELAAGEHTFRLEHFEIDGWAWLAFRLEPGSD